MLQKTRGIVLRSVKYGETSLISTVFTEHFGIESYIIKGVRTQKRAGNKAGFLQPSTLLDIIVFHQSQKSLQHLREFNPAILYGTIQQDVIKNAIALFSVEVFLCWLHTDIQAQKDVIQNQPWTSNTLANQCF